MTSGPIRSCWVVTDGRVGSVNQCVGLAEALGLDPVIKRVRMRMPWRRLSPFFRFGHAYAFAPDSDPLEPPWPDLLIASGRLSIAAALYVRKRSRREGHRTMIVFVQSPGISAKHFDLVIAPAHDRVRGDNVVATRGGLHRLTQTKLDEGAAQLLPQVRHLPEPYIGVLIGGSNGVYTMDAAQIDVLSERLMQAVKQTGGSLLITPSRRTGAAYVARLEEALAATPHFIWDGEGNNPYFGILGLSSFVVATNDSVNMISEAVSTEKPVYVFHLPGRSRKFDAFHSTMLNAGLTKPFEGSLTEFERRAAGNETAQAAAAVRAKALEIL